ncbi:MAG: hypothetical protein KUG73_04330 [Pseudomonadales bacterium]|nr:hypothetical protein [Pseudomonadales bacterium]
MVSISAVMAASTVRVEAIADVRVSTPEAKASVYIDGQFVGFTNEQGIFTYEIKPNRETYVRVISAKGNTGNWTSIRGKEYATHDLRMILKSTGRVELTNVLVSPIKNGILHSKFDHFHVTFENRFSPGVLFDVADVGYIEIYSKSNISESVELTKYFEIVNGNRFVFKDIAFLRGILKTYTSPITFTIWGAEGPTGKLFSEQISFKYRKL